MKILTKEEEEAHYSATLKGGITGGLIGLAVGASGVYAAHRRFQFIRNLTLPMKAFLTTSSSTFAAIIAADRASRRFEHEVRADEYAFYDARVEAKQAAKDAQSGWERFMTWGKENRYPIVFGSWVASMGAALGIVSRSHHLTGPQKLVQARVYAQGLTLAVLIATAAFETSDATKGEGRWETIKVLDPNDPEHKHLIEKRVHREQYPGEDLWRDMVDAEERRLNDRKQASGTSKSSSSPAKSHQKPGDHENKNKILTEANKPSTADPKDVEAKEARSQKSQNEKQEHISKHGVMDSAKVSDRNESS